MFGWGVGGVVKKPVAAVRNITNNNPEMEQLSFTKFPLTIPKEAISRTNSEQVDVCFSRRFSQFIHAIKGLKVLSLSFYRKLLKRLWD